MPGLRHSGLLHFERFHQAPWDVERQFGKMFKRAARMNALTGMRM